MINSQDKYYKQFLTALIAIDSIGRSTVGKIEKGLKKYQISPEEFWVGSGSILSKFQLNEKQISSIKKFKKAYTISSYFESLLEKQISVLTYQDKNYPALLKPLADKPVALFFKGRVGFDQTTWDKNPLAIVGTRLVTPYGEYVTQKICKELVDLGATIVSGFMYGVDNAAHRSAIENGGQTVGVLGYGFDQVTPYSQRKLFDQMLEKGMIFVSEYPPHISASAGTFPVRNRIIAGMSLGTIVMEAATRSGSLITAQWALDYGREVFAVPGPINSQFSEGTKWLINEGAKLVGSGREVVEELSGQFSANITQDSESGKTKIAALNIGQNLSFLEKKILESLSCGPLTAEQLTENISIHNLIEIINSLTTMEIKGLIKRCPQGWVNCSY